MKALWLQDVYDRTGNIVVQYHKLGTQWPDNWLIFAQEEVFIFIPTEEAAIYARY
jgi:hypothetical protein